MEIDIKKIKFSIGEIKENIAEIRKYIKVSSKEFWKDRRNILAIEHLLLQAIEATNCICIYIGAKKLRKGVEESDWMFWIVGKRKTNKWKSRKELKKNGKV